MQGRIPAPGTDSAGENEEKDMRYTKRIIMTLLLYVVLLAMGVTAAARSAEASYPAGAVDPLNAVIAAVLVFLTGGIIFVRRHR